jgi:DeoR/GlpR family transcriptional regulator of sugar metabolism
MDSKSRKRLTKDERQKVILAEVRVNSTIRVSDLADRLQVTGETIRRDLVELDAAGHLHRTFGGASVPPLTFEPGVDERSREFVEERERIGAAAAAFLPGDAVLMLDGGSTTFQVARHLAQRQEELTVVTNSLPIALLLSVSPLVRIHVAPGVLNAGERAVTGADTIEFLRRYNATHAIVGATALTLEGPAEAAEGVAGIKRIMIERAAESFVVADSGKFGRRAFETIADWGAFARLVTDAEPPQEIARAIASSGCEISVGAPKNADARQAVRAGSIGK